MARSLRDRLLAPSVARAAASPSGLLLAVGGGAAGFLAADVPGAVVGAVALWAARIGVAVPRREREERIDPFTLGEPWRHAVQDALQARARFEEAVHRARPGPLRERLEEIGERVEQGVRQAWEIGRQGQALMVARRRIDAGAVRRELEREGAAPAVADALRAQLASADRLDRTIADARDRLRVTNARLDEAAARAAELSVAAHDVAQLEGLGADVDALVTDLEALRLGLEEVRRPEVG